MNYSTERLIIRPTSIEDAEFIHSLMNSPKWIKNIGDRKVNSIEGAKEYIQKKMIAQFDRLGYGNFTIIRKADNITLGSCGLYDREGLEGVDIGFAFLPEHEGKGYGFESAVKVKEIGVNEFGLKTINAITAKHNISSQKLLEKIGLKFIKHITLPNETEELMFYQYHAEK